MPQYPTPFSRSAPASIIDEMAETLREAQQAKGFADTQDLLVAGWPQAEIDRFGPAAVVTAHRRAEGLRLARAA